MTAATGYLVIEATRRQWGSLDEFGLRDVVGTRIVALRANRPAKLARDQIAVRVTVEVPVGAFNPVTADVAVEIPDSRVLHGPIGIEATDANGDES